MTRPSLAVMFGTLALALSACGGESEEARAAGTYELDVDATADAMVEMFSDAVNEATGKLPSAEQRDVLSETWKNACVWGRIELRDDMTFSASEEARSTRRDQPAFEHTSRGNWAVKDGAFTFRFTHEDGHAVPEKAMETATGKLENGVLSLVIKRRGGGMDWVKVFKKN